MFMLWNGALKTASVCLICFNEREISIFYIVCDWVCKCPLPGYYPLTRNSLINIKSIYILNKKMWNLDFILQCSLHSLIKYQEKWTNVGAHWEIIDYKNFYIFHNLI